MQLKYKRAGIVVKPHERVVYYLKKAIEILEGWNVRVVLDRIAADLIGADSGVAREEIAEYSDIIILIGGDGTFLSVAGTAVEAQIPVGGFNLGNLGFLTELNKDKMEESLNEVFFGRPSISHRKLLQIDFKGEKYIALNDVVAHTGNIARLITLRLHIDGHHVAEVSGDGIIVSTPTGSTAYSLACGGPILTPNVNGTVITPISPHSLTFRPFIVPEDSRISVKLESENAEVCITMDGQKVIPMATGESFEVSIYGKELKMIVSKSLNYFKLLNEKLNWGL